MHVMLVRVSVCVCVWVYTHCKCICMLRVAYVHTGTHSHTQLHTGAYLPLCSVNMFSPTVGLQRLSLWDALEPPPPRLDPLEPMLMPLLPWPADWCDFMREPRSVEPALRPPPPLELPPLMQCGDPDATGLLLDTPMQLTVLPPCPPPPPPPPPLECEPRSLPCWAPILSNHMHPTTIYTFLLFLLRFISALFLFFFSLFNCMHFFFVLLFFYILSHSRICFILIRCSTHFLLCVVVVVSFSFSTPHTSFRFATPLCNLRVDKIQGCCEIANKIFARQLNNFYLL